jgi:hypothetical protein
MKQAVVLIHGIGEQIPMDTLRGFVRAVWVTDVSVHNIYTPNPATIWSKPDDASGDFELRRLTTAENRENKRTDFFELLGALDGRNGSFAFALLGKRVVASPAFQHPKATSRHMVVPCCA